MNTSKERNQTIPRVHLSVMESRTNIGHGVTLQSWFTRDGNTIIRTELYSIADGSIVAYQDCINGAWDPLYMEQNFVTFHREEDDMTTILKFAGVSSPDQACLFDMGR